MITRLQEGLAHQKENRLAQAVEAYRDVLKKEPENPDALHFLGLCMWNINQDRDEALALINRAMKIAPGHAHMHHNVASVLGGAGDIDEAVWHYKKAIEINPGYAEAYFNLGGVYKFSDDDPLTGQMKSLYAANELSDGDQEYLCFALSKALNDTGVYGDAFHFALEAARLKNPAHDAQLLDRQVAEAKDTLTGKVLAPVKGRGNSSDAPIFIVGMPRSGTTLVEQILSRHEDVFAGGELPMIGNINGQMRGYAMQKLDYMGQLHGFIPLLGDEHFSNAADACMKMITDKAKGKAFVRFTDKMPQNAFRLGLIAMMFPNARIIHVRRHPLDTCVSCFFQRFRVGHHYSYRLDWLAQTYRKYAEIMEHWRKVIPLPILDIHYEELVKDPEGGARRLMDFAGLDWSDDCLKPQDARRPVLTASRWQVRQPIYKSSLERWKRYEGWLDPLIKGLGGMEWIERQTVKT